MNKDLTVGRPESVLRRFCMPLLLSVIFQQLYNVADSLIAGNYAGVKALAAVGNSYEITLIYLAFAFGCNMGCSVVVARLFGAHDYRNMKTSIYTTFIFSAVVCVILMFVGFTCGGVLLKLINTPEDIFSDSLLYLNIYTGGLFFLFFYNIATGIFSAIGDSRTPFLFLAASSVANIFVDILFVKNLHMGVAGVAWATFICQGVSCVLSLAVVLHRISGIKHEKREIRIPLFSVETLKNIIAIAVPSTLQQCFVSVGNIVIQGIINNFGYSITAGYAAAIKLNNMVVTTFGAMGNGMSNFTAQNAGAGKTKRVGEGWRAGLKMIIAIAIVVSVVYFVFCGSLVNLFMDSDNPSVEALNAGKLFLNIVSPFYILVAIKITTDGMLRGVGRMNYFMLSTFSDLIIRVVLAFAFSAMWGSVGIWTAWPVGWIIGAGLSVIFGRRTIRLLKNNMLEK